MLPRFWRSQFYKFIGTVLFTGPCLFHAFAQNDLPLATPQNVKQIGIINHFEKLIEIDRTKLNGKVQKLVKERLNKLPVKDVTEVDIDIDLLNSVILHSNPSYLKLSSTSKCSFYYALINDLLRSAEGKVNQIIVNYTDKKGDKGVRSISKVDFINQVASTKCPEMAKLIDQFQIKNVSNIFKSINFERPTGMDHCQSIHNDWLANPMTPFLCNVHEYIQDYKIGTSNPKELAQKRSVVALLEKKIPQADREYLENLCTTLDDPKAFCSDHLNVSFWTRISQNNTNKIFAEDICSNVTDVKTVTEGSFRECLSKIRKQPDLCSYPLGRSKGLLPQPDCETLSTALNNSHLRSNYRDCPASGDQMMITNLSRILLNISNEKLPETSGQCSVISTGTVFKFNQQFNNDEYWKLEACYENKLLAKEKCYKTYFGQYGNFQESYTQVVANILKETRGADSSLSCKMLDSQDYNPLLLEHKSGCIIVYDRNQCFMNQCKHKIIYNDREINFITIKNRLALDYFPNSVQDERFSQYYLLTKDYRQSSRSLNNLTSIKNFFKKSPKGIIHGVGCAEDLLPSFYKKGSLNQCYPIPFIIDGTIKEGNKTSFVTRTAADTLQAPRIINWSLILSAVKSYQKQQPLKQWTLYGLD